MNVLRSGLVTMLLLAAFSVRQPVPGLPGSSLKRITSVRKARHRPQRRAQNHHLRRAKLRMFFALAANDRAAFDNLLDWRRTISLRVL